MACVSASPSSSITAQLVSASAHDARNDLATVHAVVQLLDDAELAEALQTATGRLRRRHALQVAVARAELDPVPSLAPTNASDLIKLAGRRARAEGAQATTRCTANAAHYDITADALRLERVLAELLHRASHESAVSWHATNDGVVVAGADATADDHAALDLLAAAAGVTLAWTDASWQLTAAASPRT
jgi:hypothetical protein